MLYSYSVLRSIATGGASAELDLNEAVQAFINEAYYGRDQVKKISIAISKLRDAYLENPNVNYTKHALNRELQAAICAAFGFKRCSIYWSRRADMTTGPFTIPRAQIYKKGQPYVVVGANPDGYYDKDHTLICVISSDLCLFDERVGLTSDEMTAILLHEIGHNFDYTIWGIVKSYTIVIQCILNAFLSIGSGEFSKNTAKSFQNLFTLAVKEVCPDLLLYAINWQDFITNLIPPVGALCRMVGRAAQPFMRLILVLFKTVGWATDVPIAVLFSPIRQISNILLRKGEIYADSFAAAYGYGPELSTALDKCNKFTSQTTIDFGPITMAMNELSMLQTEILTVLSNGHGSVQQRSLRMLDSLNTSLAQSDLSSEDKALIIEERDRLMKTYQQFMDLDQAQQDTLSRHFRSMIDSWYNGKPYILPSIELGPDYAG